MNCSIRGCPQPSGYEIGWDAWHSDGDDEEAAKRFAESRLIAFSSPEGQLWHILIKDQLGAPLRSAFSVRVFGATSGHVGAVQELDLSVGGVG